MWLPKPRYENDLLFGWSHFDSVNLLSQGGWTWYIFQMLGVHYFFSPGLAGAKYKWKANCIIIKNISYVQPRCEICFLAMSVDLVTEHLLMQGKTAQQGG